MGRDAVAVAVLISARRAEMPPTPHATPANTRVLRHYVAHVFYALNNRGIDHTYPHGHLA